MINLSMADPEHNLRPRLTVMGIGGAGGNAINNMIRCNLEGCDFIAANTDSQALSLSLAPRKIQLGMNMSRGLGAGSKPDMGRAAAEEQIADIMACLDGSDMLFVTAGMGGGTGTGAAPVIARAAREAGILTVGVVTKPFHFEGNNRMRQAEYGIGELQQYVDTLIVIPNQNLFRVANERTTFAEAFRLADEVLHSGVRGITDLMVMPGFMNLDFADVKTVMGEMGKAMMGTGEASGDNRAIQAAEAAISNPLLDDVSMKGARGVLINITGGMDMTLFEVDQAANRIREEVDPEAQIKVGSTLGEDLEGRIRVSVIATGIDASIVVSQRTSAGTGAGGNRPQIAPQSTHQTTQTATQQTQPQSQFSEKKTSAAMQQIHAQQAAQQAHLQHQTTPSHTPPSSGFTAPASGSTNYFTMPQAMTPQVLAKQRPPVMAAHLPQSQSAVPTQSSMSQAAQQHHSMSTLQAERMPSERMPTEQMTERHAERMIEPSRSEPMTRPPEPMIDDEESAAYAAEPQATSQPETSRSTSPANFVPQSRPQTEPPASSASSQQRYAPQNFGRRPTPPPMPPASAQRQEAAPPQQGQAPFDMRVTQLTTPAQQAAADKRRAHRSESLFTRITGFGLVRPSAQQLQEEQQVETPAEDEGAPQQRLSIDPSDRPNLSSDQPDDLLDIPAFLRRQTNH